MQPPSERVLLEWSRAPGWLTRVVDNGDGTEDVIELFQGQEVERYRREARFERQP